MTEDGLTMEDILYNASTAASLALDKAFERHGPYRPGSRAWGPRCIAYALIPADGELAAAALADGFAWRVAGKWVIFNPKAIFDFFGYWQGDFINPVIEAAHAELLRSGEPIELFQIALRHPDFAIAEIQPKLPASIMELLETREWPKGSWCKGRRRGSGPGSIATG